jgi:acetyl esterase
VTVALRPGVWLLLRTLTLLSAPHPDWPVEKRRAQDSADTAVLMKLFRRAPGRVVQADYQVPTGGREILVRCYVPEGTGPFPGHLYLHGGAFWAGSVADYDPLCRWYAAAGGCVVAAVDYDLAPQHKYPVQVEQAYAALRWLAANAPDLGVRADRLSVGGTSAGGSLAAAVALMARDRGGPSLCFQLLEIPVTDCSTSYPSMREFGTGYLLTRQDLEEAFDLYLASPVQAQESYASPVRTADLSGLPPALILTSGCDPLRDQGEAYAARLRDAGVPVTLRRYDGHVHSSTYLSRLFPSARRYLDDIAAGLRAAYASAEPAAAPGLATGGVDGPERDAGYE